MNLPDFIAKRTINEKKGHFSSIIYRIAIASVALGVAILLISELILGGFQNTIKNKVYGFAGHMQVTKYTLSNSFEDSFISTDTDFFQNYQQYNYIKHLQAYAFKAALLKTPETVEGVLMKGLDTHFDSSLFSGKLIAGAFPKLDSDNYSKEIAISREISKLLRLQIGDKILAYFVQDPPRYRQLTISGIYETGIEEFDEKIILGDIRLIQRLNNWEEDQVGGYEVYLQQGVDEANAEEEIFRNVESDQYVNTTRKKYRQYFEWLLLLNQNVDLLMSIILSVACFNMIAIIIILIMERTSMIGLLKAIGLSNSQIRAIFMYNGIRLTIKGLLIGNGVALGLCLLQDQFKLIKLNPENYYMEFVPIEWDLIGILSINVTVFIIVTISILLPNWIINRLKPIKAIRFN